MSSPMRGKDGQVARMLGTGARAGLRAKPQVVSPQNIYGTAAARRTSQGMASEQGEWTIHERRVAVRALWSAGVGSR